MLKAPSPRRFTRRALLDFRVIRYRLYRVPIRLDDDNGKRSNLMIPVFIYRRSDFAIASPDITGTRYVQRILQVGPAIERKQSAQGYTLA